VADRDNKRTSTSLGSTSSSPSPAPVPTPAAPAGFGVKDGDDLGDCRTVAGYCGLESASHRHTIICVQYNKHESLADAKVSARQQCVYEGPSEEIYSKFPIDG